MKSEMKEKTGFDLTIDDVVIGTMHQKYKEPVDITVGDVVNHIMTMVRNEISSGISIEEFVSIMAANPKAREQIRATIQNENNNEGGE